MDIFLSSPAAVVMTGFGIGIVLDKGRQVIRFAVLRMHHRTHQ